MSESSEYLTKRSETDAKSVSVSEYVQEITRNMKDEREIGIVREIVAKTMEGVPDGEDFCLVSNGIGHNLSERGLLLPAMEAYEFSFGEEEPYEMNRAIYAENYINSVNNYFQNRDNSSAEADAEMLKKKRPLVREARDCIVMFKNHIVYKTGHDQVMSETGSIDWSKDDQSRERAVSYQNSEGVANSLLKILNLLR